MVSDIMKSQWHILRHATCWPKGYRNHYVANAKHSAYKDLEYLVKIGLMSRRLNHLNEMSEDYVYQVTDAGLAQLKAKYPVCTWTQCLDTGAWDTGCGEIFEVIEGDPLDNDMRYCCYCGKRLKELTSAKDD